MKRIRLLLLLLPGNIGSSWFAAMCKASKAVLLVDSRIRFIDESGQQQPSPPMGNALFLLSRRCFEEAPYRREDDFARAFAAIGTVAKFLDRPSSQADFFG